jgi:hypothetical protein
MKDNETSYPNRIIDGLRVTFTRAGFTESVLKKLEKPVVAGGMLVQYSAAQQPMPPKAQDASAATAASVDLNKQKSVAK